MTTLRAQQRVAATIVGLGLAIFSLTTLHAQSLKKPVTADFVLKDLAGTKHALKDFKGKIVLLVFGELYQHNTLRALQDIKKILTVKRSYQKDIEVLLIVSEKKNTQDYLKVKEGFEIPFITLLDDQREVYANYRIIAHPSTFVIDRSGMVVADFPSYTIAYYDQVDAQLTYLLGESTKEELDRVLSFQGSVPMVNQTMERYLSLADHLRKKGWYDSAMHSYEEALKSDPASTEAYLGIGIIYLNQNKPEKAAEAFQVVLKNNPDDPGALKGMGQVYLLKGDLDRAEVLLQRAIASDYSKNDIWYVMGELYEKKGNFKEAMRYYKKNCRELLREK